MIYAVHQYCPPRGSTTSIERVRYRTVGGASQTAAVRSTADIVEKIIEEVATSRITERGATRGERQVQRGCHGGPQVGRLLLIMELLRFATAGSIDDGKSTLIGRLLYDSKAIFADQLEAVDRASRGRLPRLRRQGCRRGTQAR